MKSEQQAKIKILILSFLATFLFFCFSCTVIDPSKCSQDRDCKSSEVCKNGSCVSKFTSCSDDKDCKNGELCNKSLELCAEIPKCSKNTDCKNGEICKDGSCVANPNCVSDEKCNGLDDDCDGSVDEGIEAQSCYTGVDSSKDKGVCTGGKQVCFGGRWGSCQGEIVPKEESCNGLDDDCDGSIDNNIMKVGSSCTTGKEGICSEGGFVCKGGHIYIS